MKKILIVLILLLTTTFSVSARSTEASKFAENQYSKQYCVKPIINVLKEHTEKYNQKIGEMFIPAITYGYGSMKVKGERKCRISYMCLLNEECKPVWSYIIKR